MKTIIIIALLHIAFLSESYSSIKQDTSNVTYKEYINMDMIGLMGKKVIDEESEDFDFGLTFSEYTPFGLFFNVDILFLKKMEKGTVLFGYYSLINDDLTKPFMWSLGFGPYMILSSGKIDDEEVEMLIGGGFEYQLGLIKNYGGFSIGAELGLTAPFNAKPGNGVLTFTIKAMITKKEIYKILVDD